MNIKSAVVFTWSVYPDLPITSKEWSQWIVFLVAPRKPTSNLGTLAKLIRIANYFDHAELQNLLRHYVKTYVSQLEEIPLDYGNFLYGTIPLFPHYFVSYCYLNLNTTFVAVELSDDELLSQNLVIGKLTHWLECYASLAIARMPVFSDNDEENTPYVFFNVEIFEKQVLICYVKTTVPISGTVDTEDAYGHFSVDFPSFLVTSTVNEDSKDARITSYLALRRKKHKFSRKLLEDTRGSEILLEQICESKFSHYNADSIFYFPNRFPGHLEIEYLSYDWVQRNILFIHQPDSCPTFFNENKGCCCRRQLPKMEKEIHKCYGF